MWNVIIDEMVTFFGEQSFPEDVSIIKGLPLNHNYPLIAFTFTGEENNSLSDNNQTGKEIELNFSVWVWEKIVSATDTVSVAYETIYDLEQLVRTGLADFSQQTHSGDLSGYYTSTEILRSSFEEKLFYPQIGLELECKMTYRKDT